MLLQQAATGNEEAFTQLFNNYYPLLSTLVYRLTRSLPSTEEIVQDVFLKIWMGREALSGIVSFKAFLWVVAKNHTLNTLRKIAREQAQQAQYRQQAVHSNPHPADDELPDYYHTLIDEAIALLPAQQQKVYLLSRHERMKQAEIAQAMGLTVATVKKYMQLAVESISRYVRRHATLLWPVVLHFFIKK